MPKLTPQQQADAWNERVKVGDQVDYAEVIGGATARHTTTSEAWVLGDHSAVVKLNGKSGCFDITHCTLVPKAPAITMEAVQSSQLHSIGHDAATTTLAIRFKNKAGAGSLYHYANFTAEKFAEFRAAKSKGSYFKQHIKLATDAYPFTKIDSGLAA